MSHRDDWLALDSSALLRQCDVDTYRASGPGGQKRNKTDSAVRLRHSPSGLSVIAEESRSQHENKARAIGRLRASISLHIREPYDAAQPPPTIIGRCLDSEGRLQISRKNDDYWTLMALLLDALLAAHGEIRKAAAFLELSTSRLSALVTDDDKVMAEVNRIRREHGIRPLTR